MLNNLPNNSNLKRLAKYVYDETNKCYCLKENFIIDLNLNPIKSIQDEFIKLNKDNSIFAFSLIDAHSIPKKRIYTGSRVYDHKDKHLVK